MEETKILTQEKLYARRLANNFGIQTGLFYGKGEDQIDGNSPVLDKNGKPYQAKVYSSGGKWVGSENYAKHLSMMEEKLKIVQNQIDRRVNLNQFPTDYYDLINMMEIDLTRRRIEAMDYTTEITQEKVNTNYSRAISIKEILPFAGAFEPMKGSGDNMPMIEHKTGAKGTIEMVLYALGDARSFEDELYNLDIYSIEKVLAAVNRAHIGLRNHLCLGPMPLLSAQPAPGGWHASQLVAADVTGGTYEERLYLTLRNALRRLLGLLDEQTGQEITASRVVLLVRNQVIQFDLDRILRGQLAGFGATVTNRQPLAINEVWLYKGDRIVVGPRTHTYLGVQENHAYMFVPGPANAPYYTAIKRQLTMEVGRGDVLQLAHERRAWYFVQQHYNLEWFGSSHPDAPSPYSDGGYGYVVAIELPTFEEET
jgi:hypothetical protein